VESSGRCALEKREETVTHTKICHIVCGCLKLEVDIPSATSYSHCVDLRVHCARTVEEKQDPIICLHENSSKKGQHSNIPAKICASKKHRPCKRNAVD
jgi:hypothetical protein